MYKFGEKPIYEVFYKPLKYISFIKIEVKSWNEEWNNSVIEISLFTTSPGKHLFTNLDFIKLHLIKFIANIVFKIT